MATSGIATTRVVSRAEWLDARKELLNKEKELTRRRDAVSAERRALPWVKVDKEYHFDTPSGERTLADLFNGRRQLIVYHFMWRKEYGEGCVGCSFLADHLDGAIQHLEHNEVSLVVVARAPLNDLLAYRKRMGWKFPWVSSLNSDFNFDYHVSFRPGELASGKVYYNYTMIDASIEEHPGISVFYKDDAGDIFHTYSSYGRGNEEVIGAYVYLDLVPLGRNENGPAYNMGDWVRHHDKYDKGGFVDRTGAFISPEESASCCHSEHE